MADNEVRMMMSVLPGAMTGFAALNSGLVSINNVFGAMTRSIDAQFGLIDTAIMTTGVVVAQLGANAMDAFGQFEQGMKIVQMVSGQTRSDIEQLSQTANQFSVQYRMDIDQITEGLQTLGRAGLNSASEQAEVLENGLYTAKLEGRDLNGVLEELIQTTALLGGNLKSPEFGEQSAYVEDLMVATSMTAPITTHDVNETLKYSGGIAAAAGANIETEEGKAILEDYMGSIAAFAQKGVTGSIAGTALRAFFNKPATQDSSVKEALASINLKPEYLWEDDEQTMKPVSEQIRIINNQMKELNISTMDQLQIWSKIVGGKMGQQMMKLDADSIKELTSDIRAADNASSLATNSMKTYEANVKALGESGALLQRNVGEKLVFFANPILEILNKISSFANQDFMSWPIAIGIMSFIGLAGKKALGVLSALKTEIATLYSGMKQGLSYFTQKQGIVRAGDNPLDDEKERYKAYFKAKDEYYGRTPPTKGGGQQKVPTTLKDFSKSFTSQIKQSGALTLQAFQKAGISNEKIALAGHLQGLTSSKNSMNLPEGQLWAAALKNNLISQEQFNSMFKAYGAGVNPRPTADLVGIESVIPQIKACQQALIDLGMSAEQARSIIWTEEERTAAEKFARQSIDETTNSIIKQISAERDKEIAAEEEMVLEQERISKTKVSQEELSVKTSEASAHMTALGDEVKVTTQNIVMNTTIALSEVEAEFAKLASNIRLFNSVPIGTNSSGQKGPVIGGYTPLPSNIHQMMNSAYVPHKDIEQRAREIRANSLALKDSAMRARALEEAYKKPYIQEKTGRTTTDARIEAALRGKNLKNDFKEYNDAQAAHYQRLFNQHVNNIRSTYVGAGVGGVSGRLPSQDAINASIKANEEVEKQKQAARISSLGAQARAGAAVANNFQENLKKQSLANVQYGEAELEAHRQGVIAENEILLKRRQAAESLSQNKASRDLGTEKDRKKFQEERTKGNLITARKDIDDIRKKSKEDFNTHQRVLSTEKDRKKFQEESTRSNMVSQSEAQRFRDQAKNQVELLKKSQQPHEVRTLPGFQQALGKYGNQVSSDAMNNIKTAEILNQNKDVLNRIQSNPRIVGTGYSNDKNWSNFSGGYGLVGRKGAANDFGSAFAKSFSERINRDRTGSFLSFGSTTVNGVTRSATKGLSGLANKALNLSDAFGGPLMIAIMTVTTAIQIWQKAFQDYCEKLKEAEDKLQEAYSNWSSAEDSLEKSFKESNPDATDEEIDQMIYDTYSTMDDDMANAINNGAEEWFKKLNYKTETGPEYEYDEEKDDGSIKEKEPEELSADEEYTKAIKENTGALYSASAELNKALDNYTRQATDSWWGLDGWTGKLTDNWISVVGAAFGPLGMAVTEGVKEVTRENFSDNNEFLLTQSQKDENYAGYTEMAGLMLEDFKDAKGNWIKGMRTMMGNDVDDMAHTFKPGTSTYKYLKDMANFSSGIGAGGLTAQKNAKLQASMKNDPKTWKKLGKELAKRDTAKKAGKNIEKQEKRIEGIAKKINRSLGSGFSKTQILQAAYLQQLQDMYQIAEQAMVPIMQKNMETAMSTLSVAGQVDGNTGATVNTTDGTQQNAAIIASLVAIIAKTKAKETYFDAAVGGSTTEGHITDVTGDGVGDDKDVYWINKAREDGMDANKFYAEYSKAYDEAALSRKNIGGFGGFNAVWDWQKEGLFKDNDKIQEGALGYLRLYHATSKMEGYDYTPEKAAEAARKFAIDVRDGGITLNDAIKTAEKNYQSDRYKQKIIDAYNLSGEDDGDGSGGGGGGGGGGDSGDKDNTGTKKERVDLVLCNKKEIPKLNVNLFKKPPTFTVLNKNFKLRDVKINTQDKPKAIMASIKNAFIDVQKRSDPKIIQDEEAEYDPVGATDGNSVPSGSSTAKTDSKKNNN